MLIQAFWCIGCWTNKAGELLSLQSVRPFCCLQNLLLADCLPLKCQPQESRGLDCSESQICQLTSLLEFMHPAAYLKVEADPVQQKQCSLEL